MIETERLIIRRFVPNDAQDVFDCCNDYEVVKTTLGIPWPYTKEMAESWIAKLAQREEEGSSYEFAICLKENPDKIIGCIFTQVSDVEDETNGLLTYDRKILKVNENDFIEIKNKIDKEFYHD